MSDQIEQGEPCGPPVPEVLVNADGDEIVITGTTAKWLLGVLAEVQICGRSESTDKLCGDFVARVSEVRAFEVQADEHEAHRAA